MTFQKIACPYIFYKIAVLLPTFTFLLSIFLLKLFMMLARSWHVDVTWTLKVGHDFPRVPTLCPWYSANQIHARDLHDFA